MENKETDIFILENIFLLASNVRVNNNNGKNSYCPALMSYNADITEIEDSEDEFKYQLSAQMGFDIMLDEGENALFDFKCVFLTIYKGNSKESLNEKLNSRPHVILAHVIPYVREFVQNNTTRMPVPTLVMDPINTLSLFKEYEARKKIEEETSETED